MVLKKIYVCLCFFLKGARGEENYFSLHNQKDLLFQMETNNPFLKEKNNNKTPNHKATIFNFFNQTEQVSWFCSFIIG